MVFTWDPEVGEYGRAWPEDEEHDDELLEGLWEDMDLRTLLPRESVERAPRGSSTRTTCWRSSSRAAT